MSRDLNLLMPQAKAKALQLVEQCRKEGLIIAITDTLRNAAEQQDCVNRGTSSVRYPNSMHNWGVAFDFCRNDGAGAYNDASNFFNRVGAVGRGIGLEWGGDWTSPVDKPHFQLADWGTSTAKLKSLYGTPENFKTTWTTKSNKFLIEVGVFSEKTMADKCGDFFQSLGYSKATSLVVINNFFDGFIVRTGVFKDRKDADNLVEKLKKKGYPSASISAENVVEVGVFSNVTEANKCGDYLHSLGFAPATSFLVLPKTMTGYVVQVGLFDKEQDAIDLKNKAIAKGYPSASYKMV